MDQHLPTSPTCLRPPHVFTVSPAGKEVCAGRHSYVRGYVSSHVVFPHFIRKLRCVIPISHFQFPISDFQVVLDPFDDFVFPVFLFPSLEQPHPPVLGLEIERDYCCCGHFQLFRCFIFQALTESHRSEVGTAVPTGCGRVRSRRTVWYSHLCFNPPYMFVLTGTVVCTTLVRTCCSIRSVYSYSSTQHIKLQASS